MSNIEPLAKALKADLEILTVKSKIKALPERKQFEEAAKLFGDIEAIYKEVEKQKLAIEAKIKKVEQEIAAVNERISREEKKLFSGTITNPKELNAIQKELDSFKNRNDGFETQELELLQELDTVNEQFDKISEKHKESSDDKEKKQKAYEQKLAGLENDLQELRTKARDIKQVIDPMLLFKYEQLSEQKGGIGAAFYKDGTCSGCHIALPRDEAAKFLEKDDLGKCSNCKRILIPPEYADV